MSVARSSAEHVLNPDVYLNHFSPEEAHEEEIRRDMTMVLVGIVLWDVFAYIPSDLKIIRECRFRFIILCFIVSRLMVIVYMFNVMVHRTLPVDDYNLDAIWYTAATAIVLVIISSSYLFLQRVLAVYNTEKWVRRCFITSWVILSIESSIAIPLGGKPTVFPGGRYYRTGELKPYVALGNWGLLVFDTAVVVAISVKLARSYTEYHHDSSTVSWYSVLTGEHLPRFARAVLRGGQLYYIMTVGVMLLDGIVLSIPMVPPIYGDITPSFFVFFSGSMACRVFRNTRLFDFDDVVYSSPDLIGNHVPPDYQIRPNGYPRYVAD